jgi:hypothetical protein
MVSRIRFGSGPFTALSIDRDCVPLENVSLDFDSGDVVACKTEILLRAVSGEMSYAGFGLMRLTRSLASRNLKVVFDAASLFMRKKS